MLDFELQRCTRRCAATGRELAPGESCVSVLVPEGGRVVRLDYAPDAWPGPPEQAIGWWRARVPDGAVQRVHWAPNDVMLDYFERLEGQPQQRDVRYVLTLLLIRRRLLRLEGTSTDAAEQEQAILFCPRNEREYRVDVVLPSEDRVRAIQQELSALLFGGPTSAGVLPTTETPSPKTPVDEATGESPSPDGLLADPSPPELGSTEAAA